jgi:TrmH family RNA methyltransferase
MRPMPAPTQSNLDRLRVVLVSTRNPLNIGAAARAMTNFGFRYLRVVNPYAPAFREARSAVGASSLLANAEQYATVPEAIADCAMVIGTTAIRKRVVHHEVRRLEQAARVIRTRLGSSRVALLFGSEKFGLSNDDLSHCHWLLHIPTDEGNISMNLGQAVAVCLYELIRDRTKAGPPEKVKLADGADVERITASLIDVLRASGYLQRRVVFDSEQRLRRLVRRLQIPAGDVGAWLGMLRQILWRAGDGNESDAPRAR